MAWAQDESLVTMPADPARLDVRLLTVGRGPQIWALYGHSILRVIDPLRGTDLNFNWGIFDFRDPLFAWNFYRGDLIYSLQVTDFGSLMDHYRQVEHRAVYEQTIQLTPAQKRALMSQLVRNAQPEQLRYRYAQFADNCATKPRDHLNAALGGVLKPWLVDRPSDRTFRDDIRAGARPLWWVEVGLDLGSNQLLDRPMSQWDAMFLPAALSRYLSLLPAFDDQGQPMAGSHLLGPPTEIVAAPEPEPGTSPYGRLALLLGVPAAAAALAGHRSRRSSRLLGLAGILFCGWSAVLGTLLTLDWGVSHYPELRRNALLLLFWPVDWLFVWDGLRRVSGRWRAPSPLLSGLAALHLAALVVLVILAWIGVVRQSILGGLESSGLPALLYYGMMVGAGLAPKSHEDA